MPPRTLIALRLAPAGLSAVDELATQAGTTRSEMIRRLLTAAATDPTIRTQVTRSAP